MSDTKWKKVRCDDCLYRFETHELEICPTCGKNLCKTCSHGQED